MTIYTIIGSTGRIEWIAKSFTCEQAATQFLSNCARIARRADLLSELSELLAFSPDPTIQTESVKRNLTLSHINYTLHINELVTDAFMELTLQPHKPRPFKELI